MGYTGLVREVQLAGVERRAGRWPQHQRASRHARLRCLAAPLELQKPAAAQLRPQAGRRMSERWR